MIYPDEEMLFAPVEWHDCSHDFTDILFHKSSDGIAKITLNRPDVRNAFRPKTVKEMLMALSDARHDEQIGVIILTGAGEKAFCAGAIRKSVATTAATATMKGCTISTYSISSARSVPARNRWWRWWQATPWAAVTYCICSAI